MKITRITKNPDKVKRKVILDTDRVKEKVSSRLDDFNDGVDRKIDKVCKRIINFTA